jgi:hypothetical protein
MTNKTPFELRFDLLSLAQGILNEKAFAERQRLENDWSFRRDLMMADAHTQGDKISELKPEPYPVMPAVNADEIIELAKKLNEFVSNSGDTKNA